MEGLVSTVPSKEMRRGLTLIAKIIQNLANNVLFGAKEPYMFPLNDFLTHEIYRVTTFLREISVRCSLMVGRSKASDMDRSRQRDPRAPQGMSRLTSVPVSPSIGSCMTIGTMCANA